MPERTECRELGENKCRAEFFCKKERKRKFRAEFVPVEGLNLDILITWTK